MWLPALLLLASCGDSSPPEWREGEGYRWRPLRVESGDGVGFTALSSEETGVEFANRVTDDQAAHNRILSQGSGVALGDVDGDGRVDVYLSRIEGPNELYRNRGGFRFREVGEAAGVSLPDRASTGAVLADVDGDGDLDLLVGVLGGRNVLLANDGAGRFREVRSSGLSGEGGTSTLALADVDADGDLDLYVTNYKRRAADDIFAPQERSRSRVIEEVDGEYRVRPKFREHYRIGRDERGEVGFVEKAEPDAFYLNDGAGRFRAQEWTSGRFRGRGGEPLGRAPDEWGLTARFRDVDADGDADLYVCNDLESPDHFWLNQGQGRFRRAGWRVLRKTSGSSMAVDFADVDRDGALDMFVADMLSRDPVRRKKQVSVLRVESSKPGELKVRPQVNRNTLQLGRGDGTYAEVARYAGVAASEWTWGVVFLDVDLDGWQDLLVTNGHVADVLDIDTQMRLSRTRPDPDRIFLMYPSLEVSNLAFRNEGGVRFREVGSQWGWDAGPDVSHGLALGDLDGDGDLDVVVNRMNARALVLRNESTSPRVKVSLAGESPNTRGIGARVRLVGGPGGVQEREVSAGGLYLSSSAPEVTFAAGGSGAAGGGSSLRLEVEWPGGARSVIDGVRPGREYEVREPSSASPPEPDAVGSDTVSSSSSHGSTGARGWRWE